MGQGLCGRPSGPVPTDIPTAPASPCSLRRPPMPASIPGKRSPRATAAPPALFIAPHCRALSCWHHTGAGGGWHGQSIPQGIGWHSQAIPVRHRARLARPEWLCQWISQISSSQSGQHGHRGSHRAGRGWQPGIGGGGGDHDCTQGLHAAAACGQRFSQAQGGLVEPAGVLGGVLSGVGTPRRRWAACLEGHLPNVWSSSWFASPARHGGHQPCRRLLAATERRSRALATSSTAAAAGSATDRALHHGLWPWAGGGCPGGARPRNPPLLPALRAGQCRQLPAMLCSAKHAGQTTAQHSRGGWWLQPPSNSFPTHGSLAKTNADSGQPESLVSQK